jgi:Fe-Mn family superoxide dismutase
MGLHLEHYPFVLRPLPYAYDGLEPFVDARTVEVHHDRHLGGYVKKLNMALEKYPEYHGWPLEKLLGNLTELPKEIQAAVRNNGGGVYNHNMYFDIMAPGGVPLRDGALKAAIERTWGSVDGFLAEFKKAGLDIFGSGTAWLVACNSGLDGLGELSIYKTPNQDTPIPAHLKPIIPLDVWEHAYYLKHLNEREKYIDDWFKVINWEQAERNYVY